MKHFSLKKSLITAFLIVCLCAMWTVSTHAAGISKLCNYTEQTRTFKKDITGDGKADKIKIKLVKDRYQTLDKINIFVNGKKSGSLDCSYSYGISVDYIVMSKKNVFLRIYSLASNDHIEANSIFKYNKKTKKLDNVLNFRKVGGGVSMTAQKITSVSGSQIKVLYTGQPSETGRIECTYTFVFKNGKFKLKSDTVSVKSVFSRYPSNDKYGKYLAKNQFVAEKTLKLYKTSSLKKASFTAKRGDILTLKKIKIAGGKTYLQFKKGSKTGWVKVYNDYMSVYPDNEHGWFCGILYRLAG